MAMGMAGKKPTQYILVVNSVGVSGSVVDKSYRLGGNEVESGITHQLREGHMAAP